MAGELARFGVGLYQLPTLVDTKNSFINPNDISIVYESAFKNLSDLNVNLVESWTPNVAPRKPWYQPFWSALLLEMNKRNIQVIVTYGDALDMGAKDSEGEYTRSCMTPFDFKVCSDGFDLFLRPYFVENIDPAIEDPTYGARYDAQGVSVAPFDRSRLSSVIGLDILDEPFFPFNDWSVEKEANRYWDQTNMAIDYIKWVRNTGYTGCQRVNFQIPSQVFPSSNLSQEDWSKKYFDNIEKVLKSDNCLITGATLYFQRKDDRIQPYIYHDLESFAKLNVKYKEHKWMPAIYAMGAGSFDNNGTLFSNRIEDFQQRAFLPLMYGAKGVIWWQYKHYQPDSAAVSPESLEDYGIVYNNIKQINLRLHKIGSAIFDASWRRTFHESTVNNEGTLLLGNIPGSPESDLSVFNFDMNSPLVSFQRGSNGNTLMGSEYTKSNNDRVFLFLNKDRYNAHTLSVSFAEGYSVKKLNDKSGVWSEINVSTTSDYMQEIGPADILILEVSPKKTQSKSITTSTNILLNDVELPYNELGDKIEYWQTIQGNVSASTNLVQVSQGTASLNFTSSGYSLIRSSGVSLSNVPINASEISFDLYVPEQLSYWKGAVQLYVTLPQANLWNQYIGQTELASLTVNKFNRLVFPIPDYVNRAITSNLGEIQLGIAFNTASEVHFIVDAFEFK